MEVRPMTNAAASVLVQGPRKGAAVSGQVQIAEPDGSPNLYRVVTPAVRTQRKAVEAFLEERPDLARSPRTVAKLLHMPEGSAKRILKEIRDATKVLDLGPVLLQNLRLSGRTLPDTVRQGSPTLDALVPWEKREDAIGKYDIARVPIPPDAGAEVILRDVGTLELRLSAPRGLTPSEVRTILALFRLPFDRESPFTLSFEMFKDGRSLRFEGIACRTYEDADGHLIKLYDHTDERGTFGRVEIRSPPVKASWPEIEAFLDARQLLGRDARIDRLTDMVEDMSRALVRQGKEIIFMRKALDTMRGEGSRPVRPPSHGGMRLGFAQGSPFRTANDPAIPPPLEATRRIRSE